MKPMHFNTLLLTALTVSLALISPAEARSRGGGGFGGGGFDAGGGGFNRGGGGFGGQTQVNLQDRGNFSPSSGNMNRGNFNSGNVNTGNVNRGNVNTGNVNRGNINTGNVNTGNVNRGNVNTGNVNTGNWNSGNVNTGNVNRGNVNTGNINTGNVNVGNDVTVNTNNNWRGGGWYGTGYSTPPGWGAATFGAGLAIGAAVSSPPPYYNTVYAGSTSYYYSDGVYMQPQGSQYIVVAPPVGAVVSYLPQGCTVVVQNGVQYENCSGAIYQPFMQNGTTVYRVVSTNQ